MPSNQYLHAKSELDILVKNNHDDELIITPFIPQILALIEAFGESGQSGASAPFTAGNICNTLKRLFAFQPLSPLTGDDSEWNDASSLGNDPVFQNNRCSRIFKGLNGVAYDIDGYVFWHWSERSLCEDEAGYPGIQKYKSYFTSGMSCKLVEFPCEVPERAEVEVKCYEVNKDTGLTEKGSAWWHTIYPDWLIDENATLVSRLKEPPVNLTSQNR